MANQPKTDKDRHPEKYFTSPKGHPKDRIIIHPTLNTPKEGIFLSLNGYGFLVKPGVEVDLPRPVVKMLDTLVITETINGDDGKEYYRDLKRFNYTLVKQDIDAVPVVSPVAEETPT